MSRLFRLCFVVALVAGLAAAGVVVTAPEAGREVAATPATGPEPCCIYLIF